MMSALTLPELIHNFETWAWLDAVLNADDRTSQTSVSYLCQPAIETPQFLLPADTPQITAASLTRFNDGRSIKQRLVTSGAVGVARTGLLRRARKPLRLGETITLPNWDIVEDLSVALGESNLVAAVTIGPPRRNRKPVLQLLKRNGETVGYAKIGWSSLTRELVKNEATVLKKVASQLPDTITAPKVLLEQTWHDNQVTVISALKPSPLAQRAQAVPVDTLLSLARSSQTIHLAVRQMPFLKEWKKTKLGSQPFMGPLLKKYGDNQLELGLWHGDYTPWNTSTVKGVVSVWDWEFAAFGRPVGFDILHCNFELLRRDESYSTQDALEYTEAKASELLQNSSDFPDAVFDLYLCELWHRELKLSGQRWQPTDLEELLPALKQILFRRLT